LAITLGLRPIGRVTQRRGQLAPGVVVGEGKLAELAAWTGGTGIVPSYQKPGMGRRDIDTEVSPEPQTDAFSAVKGLRGGASGSGELATVVLVDHELSPTQQHNLERATGV